jgi:UDP-N-acetylglucosamine 2-epimerase (non-hydrolysing)
MKILSVLGTRPEAIKLGPIVRELKRRAQDRDVLSIVCVTAQHREMLDEVLNLFDIVPHYDLNVMQRDQSLCRVSSAVFSLLEPVLLTERPDWLLVQGDTTTVAAASLAGFYSGIKVAHVEAGLRTHDKWRPFPEEMNRRIASLIAELHFAPTEGAKKNLLREGVPSTQILVTGNPVIDALHWVASFDNSGTAPELQTDGVKRILVTAHRRENFGAPLRNICSALRELAERYRGLIEIVYPVHRNPNVSNPVHQLLADVPNIRLLPPLSYLPLVRLMKDAFIVLTDSGGIQEEAPSLGKPVLVLRDVTERPEAVLAGTVRIVGTDPQRIVAETANLLDNSKDYDKMAHSVNPYGDGHAAARIVGALLGETITEMRIPSA